MFKRQASMQVCLCWLAGCWWITSFGGFFLMIYSSQILFGSVPYHCCVGHGEVHRLRHLALFQVCLEFLTLLLDIFGIKSYSRSCFCLLSLNPKVHFSLFTSFVLLFYWGYLWAVVPLVISQLCSNTPSWCFYTASDSTESQTHITGRIWILYSLFNGWSFYREYMSSAFRIYLWLDESVMFLVNLYPFLGNAQLPEMTLVSKKKSKVDVVNAWSWCLGMCPTQ